MIDSVSVWKSEWDNIVLDGVGSFYPARIAAYIAARVDNKLSFAPPVFGSTTYAFDQGTFIAGITGFLASPAQYITNRTAFANAWRDAAQVSIPIVSSGAYVGAPTPPTLWSAPPIAVPIVTAGYASLLAATLAAQNVNTLGSSTLPVAIHDAFLLIQFTLTGLNSVIPPAGPQPLIATALVL